MHCEKNLNVNILKTILGEKDSRKVINDLQDLGVCDSLWLKPHPTKIGEIVMFPAPWAMHKENRFFFGDNGLNKIAYKACIRLLKTYYER
jgi:hypothetical protein